MSNPKRTRKEIREAIENLNNPFAKFVKERTIMDMEVFGKSKDIMEYAEEYAKGLVRTTLINELEEICRANTMEEVGKKATERLLQL